MKHLYEGEPDGRQEGGFEPSIVPSRFRPSYRALTGEEKALMDEIKAKAVELDALYDKVGWRNPRYHDFAISTLEQSVMWIVKELTLPPALPPEDTRGDA